jgi:hypothetical protein
LNEVDLPSIGIAEDARIETLAFDESSSTSVLTVRSTGNVISGTLHVRSVVSQKYEQVQPPERHYFHHRLLVDSRVSRAYVIAIPESGSGGALGIVSLPHGVVQIVRPSQAARPTERLWISNLIGLGKDDNNVLVQLGYAPCEPYIPHRATYRICRMNTTTGWIDELHELATPFG